MLRNAARTQSDSRDILFEGQELQVRILHLDPAHQRWD